MAVSRLPCADLSRHVGEQVLGTASASASWVLVEHPGPWPADVRERDLLDRLPDEVRHRVVRLLDEQALRPILIRRVGERRRAVNPRTVLVGSARPGRRWCERLVVDRVEDVADLDWEAIAAGEQGHGEPVVDPVWLVCTHGQRDACCAVRGRPVAEALDAELPGVWESTHLGGHRFAGNLLALPHGLLYGHVDPVDALRTAREVAAGRVPLAGLRGRTTATPPEQVAEAAVRRATGLDGLDDVVAEAVVGDAGAGQEVVVRAAGRRHRIHVTGRDHPETCQASCNEWTPRRWAVDLGGAVPEPR